MGWRADSGLTDVVRDWWAEIKPGLAVDVRTKLVRSSLALGVAATIAMRAANRIGDWGIK